MGLFTKLWHGYIETLIINELVQPCHSYMKSVNNYSIFIYTHSLYLTLFFVKIHFFITVLPPLSIFMLKG